MNESTIVVKAASNRLGPNRRIKAKSKVERPETGIGNAWDLAFKTSWASFQMSYFS